MYMTQGIRRADDLSVLAVHFEGTENVIAAHRLSQTAPSFVCGEASRKTTASSK